MTGDGDHGDGSGKYTYGSGNGGHSGSKNYLPTIFKGVELVRTHFLFLMKKIQYRFTCSSQSVVCPDVSCCCWEQKCQYDNDVVSFSTGDAYCVIQ